MSAEKPKILTKTDGSVVVFYRGWCLAFPDGGGKPAVERGTAPPGARVNGRKVKAAGLFMYFGRWVAIFDPTAKRSPAVAKAMPSLPDITNHLYLKYRRED